MSDETRQYVFRGTTAGFAGNATSNGLPCTRVTFNPAKALLFALSAAYEYKKQGVVYIADVPLFGALPKTEGNCFESYEEEIGFAVKPADFQAMCPGYVLAETLRDVLAQSGTHLNLFVHPQNLSRMMREMRTFTPAETERIVRTLAGRLKRD